MRYIIRLTLGLILFGAMACDNGNKESRIKKRMAINYTNFEVYVGTTSGATSVDMWTNHSNKDSLYRALFINKYFQPVYGQIGSANTIQFEFIEDNDLLMVIENGRKTVSSYLYEKNDLYIYQKNIDEGDKLIYVATKDENGQFYRIKSAQYSKKPNPDYIPPSGGNPEQGERFIVEVAVMKDTEGKATIESLLEFGEYASKEDVTNEKDTLMLCNVKYFFR